MARKVRHRERPRPKSATPVTAEHGPITPTKNRTKTSDDFAVGYGKPPNHTRFKPGRSGNPKGRPKGSKNLKTELAEELQEQVSLKEGGVRRVVSKQRAMLKSLMAKAVQGDAKAASLIINSIARFLDQSDDDDRSAPLAEEDLAILKDFEAHIRKSTK